MATEIAGVATWRDTVTAQVDGDPDTAAFRNLAAEDLTDRTSYLKTRTDKADEYSARLALVASAVTTSGNTLTAGPSRVIGYHGAGVYGSGAAAGYPETLAGISQASAGSSAIYWDVTDLIPTATGTKVSMLYAWIEGQSYSVLPSTMPKLQLLEVTNAGALSTVATVIDTSSSVGAFNAGHSLVVGGLAVTPASGRVYILKFDFGAGGTGNGIKVRQVSFGVAGTVAP